MQDIQLAVEKQVKKLSRFLGTLEKLVATDSWDSSALPSVLAVIISIEKDNNSLIDWAYKFGFVKDEEYIMFGLELATPKKRGTTGTPRTQPPKKQQTIS